MKIKLHCGLCGGVIEGQVVKVAAYAKPVSQGEEDFLQPAGQTDELDTAFAHPACAGRLRAAILEAFADAAEALGRAPEGGAKK